MKNYLKSVSIVLVLLSVFLLFAACGKKQAEGLQFTLNEDGASYTVALNTNITENSHSGPAKYDDPNIVIPASYNDLPVTAISLSGFSNTGITSVTIPDTIKTIGRRAFHGCEQLQTVTFEAGSQLQTIDDEAFDGCTALTEITLPHSVTAIGSLAFQSCTSLTTFTWPDGVAVLGDQLKNCYNLKSILFTENSTLHTIEAEAFYRYEGFNLENIEFPKSLTTIGASAFANSKLQSVTFPNDSALINIGEGAFSDCDSLTSIAFGENSALQTIGKNAFSHCDSLIKFRVPKTVRTIEENAFISCENLRILTFEEESALTTIEAGAFRETRLLVLALPEGLTTLDSTAIDRRFLVSITIPSTLTAIDGLFYKSSDGAMDIPSTVIEIINHSAHTIDASNLSINRGSLFHLTTGDSQIEIVDDYLFYTNEGVNYLLGYIGADRQLTTPNSYNGESYEIIEDAFSKDKWIESLTISDGVTKIGGGAFYSCNNLTYLFIPETAECYTGSQFFDFDNEKLTIYVDSLSQTEEWIGKDGAFQLKVREMTPSEGLEYLLSDDGTFYIVTGIGTCTDSKVVIPDTYQNLPVTAVAKEAFINNLDITRCYLSSNTTYIGAGAFAGCENLVKLNVPDTLAYVGNNAVNGCSRLKYNTYDNAYYLGNETNPYVALVKGTDTQNTSCQVHEQTKVLFPNAFFYHGLTSLSLPEGLVYIGENAIMCSNLTKISIPNSVQWIASNNFTLATGLTLTAYDNGYYLGNEQNPYVVFYKAKNTSITSCTIHPDTVVIYHSAFANCRNLTSIEIPDKVLYIERAFYNCTSLQSVSFGANSQLFYLGASTFNGCTVLKNVTLPQSVSFIGTMAFANCTSLNSIVLPAGVQYVELSAFNGSPATINVCVAQQPSLWNEDWNANGGTVVWNYKP